MHGEELRPVCPMSNRGCNRACRMWIREGDKCGVVEWMRITGTYLENISKRSMDPDILMAIIAKMSEVER